MKKQYKKPSMNISIFLTENIVTDSGTDTGDKQSAHTAATSWLTGEKAVSLDKIVDFR
ncbi:MAG: hypothetical protein ACI4TH_09355 [Candidatus Ornithomonoglobus sp.]